MGVCVFRFGAHKIVTGQMVDLAFVTIEMVIKACVWSGSPEAKISQETSGSLGVRGVDSF